MCSRRRGHSSAAALDSRSGEGICGMKPGEDTSIIVIAHGTACGDVA